jgi:hypothetical protein
MSQINRRPAGLTTGGGLRSDTGSQARPSARGFCLRRRTVGIARDRIGDDVIIPAAVGGVIASPRCGSSRPARPHDRLHPVRALRRIRVDGTLRMQVLVALVVRLGRAIGETYVSRALAQPPASVPTSFRCGWPRRTPGLPSSDASSRRATSALEPDRPDAQTGDPPSQQSHTPSRGISQMSYLGTN